MSLFPIFEILEKLKDMYMYYKRISADKKGRPTSIKLFSLGGSCSKTFPDFVIWLLTGDKAFLTADNHKAPTVNGKSSSSLFDQFCMTGLKNG